MFNYVEFLEKISLKLYKNDYSIFVYLNKTKWFYIFKILYAFIFFITHKGKHVVIIEGMYKTAEGWIEGIDRNGYIIISQYGTLFDVSMFDIKII